MRKRRPKQGQVKDIIKVNDYLYILLNYICHLYVPLQSVRGDLLPGRELLSPVRERFLRAHAKHLQRAIFSRVRRK